MPRREEKCLDDVMEMPINSVRSYIYHAEIVIKQDIAMANALEKEIEKAESDAERASLVRKHDKYLESAEWFKQQLPIYQKAYDRLRDKQEPSEMTPKYTNRVRAYSEYLEFTNKAVKAAMAEGEVEAGEYIATADEAVIAISPYLGNRARCKYIEGTKQKIEDIAIMKKRREYVSREDIPYLMSEIAKLECDVADLRQKTANVVSEVFEKYKVEKEGLMEYLYRFQRHVLFNDFGPLGNVKEVRYADGVIWVLIEVIPMTDPGLRKQMESALSRCYLPHEHAMVWRENVIPSGHTLWHWGNTTTLRFSLKWHDLLMSKTYANVWYRVKAELQGSKKKKPGLEPCTRHWWEPVLLNDMRLCKPKVPSVRDL